VVRSHDIERTVTHAFQDAGWFSRRAASSGGGSDHPSYDVIAGKNATVYVMEVKYRDPDEHIYIEEQEVADLEWVGRQLGAYAAIVVRWKQDTTLYGYFPEQLYQTQAGTFRVSDSETEYAAFTVPPDEPPEPKV